MPQFESRNRSRIRLAEAAKTNSSAPSGGNGGDLGTFAPGQMVKEFNDVVFTGELNKVHGPVQTQFGYHLIEITSRRLNIWCAHRF